MKKQKKMNNQQNRRGNGKAKNRKIPRGTRNPQDITSINNRHINILNTMDSANQIANHAQIHPNINFDPNFNILQFITPEQSSLHNIHQSQHYPVSFGNNIIYTTNGNQYIPNDSINLNRIDQANTSPHTNDNSSTHPLEMVWMENRDMPVTNLEFSPNFDVADNYINFDEFINSQSLLCQQTVLQNPNSPHPIRQDVNQSWPENTLDSVMNQICYTGDNNIQTVNFIPSQNYIPEIQQNLNTNNELINQTATYVATPMEQVNFPPEMIVNSQSNYILRVINNDQVHFISVDQATMNQIIAGSLPPNLIIPQQSNNVNGALFDQQNDINNQIIYTGDLKNAIHITTEGVDLMENAANWKKIPNNGGFQCNICNKSYTRKYGLKIHLRIHSGFKPLECKVCNKRFGDPSNMAKHIRLHSTEGSPYKCNLCGKHLVRRRDLERHMRSRHPGSAPQADPPRSPKNTRRKPKNN